jgi:hypothetical protein
MALKAPSSGDLKIIWARALIGNATVPEDLALVARLADGEETIEGLTIDQDMRWAIAAKHVAHGVSGAEERVAAEAERDATDRGVRAKLRCEISVPSEEVKAMAWEKFTGEGYGSLYLTNAAMSGFNWSEQRALTSSSHRCRRSFARRTRSSPLTTSGRCRRLIELSGRSSRRAMRCFRVTARSCRCWEG